MEDEIDTKPFQYDVPELGFSVIARQLNSSVITFDIYNIIYQDPIGRIYWQDAKSTESIDDISKAGRFLTGDVKWDGCSNWSFDDQETCMLHFCSRNELENVGKIMAYCWDIAEQWFPNFWGKRERL